MVVHALVSDGFGAPGVELWEGRWVPCTQDHVHVAARLRVEASAGGDGTYEVGHLLVGAGLAT